MGITYLHSFDFLRIANRQQAATAAMALQAIYRFSNDISLPIEDFVASQRLIQSRARNIASIDVATKLISILQAKISSLYAEKSKLEKVYTQLSQEHSRVQYFRTVARTIIPIMIIFLLVSGIFFTYAALHIPGFLNDFVSVVFGVLRDWLVPYWWLPTIIAIVGIIVILRRFSLLPQVVFRIIQFISSLFNINLKDDKPEEHQE